MRAFAPCILLATLVTAAWSLTSSTLAGSRSQPFEPPSLQAAQPAQRAGAASLERVAQHGGYVEGLAVEGDHIYAAVGARLLVLDADFAEGALPLATVMLDVEQIYHVAGTGDGRLVVYAQTDAEVSALLVLDLEDPLAPHEVSRWRQEGGGPIAFRDGSRLIARPGQVWLASFDGVRAFDLESEGGIRVASRWKFPLDGRFVRANWHSVGLIGDRLIGATNQVDLGTPGPPPTPCPGGGSNPACPTPRVKPLARQRLWTLDARSGVPLTQVGQAPIDLIGDDIPVYVGDRWVATTVGETGTVELWTITEGTLAREKVLSKEWLREAGITRVAGLSLATSGDLLWLGNSRQLHAVDLGRPQPQHLGVITGPNLGTSQYVRPARARLFPVPQGDLLLAGAGVRRVPRDHLGRPLPVLEATTATDHALRVAADPDGAWAVLGPGHDDLSRLWRIPEEGAARFVTRSLHSAMAFQGERLVVANTDGLRAWREVDASRPFQTSSIELDSSAPARFDRLVAGAPEDGLLAREEGWGNLWHWLAPDGVRRRVGFGSMLTLSANHPVLAEGVPWILRSEAAGSITIVAGEVDGNVLQPRPPGMVLPPSALAWAGHEKRIVVLHDMALRAGTMRLVVIGWDDPARPRLLGEITVSDDPLRSGTGSVVLDDSIAWVALQEVGGVVVSAIDLTLPSFPEVIAHRDLSGATLRQGGPVFAARGETAWVGDDLTGAIHQLRLQRPATPSAPTRPPPTATRTTLPSATPTPTAEPTPTPPFIALPWAAR